MSDTTSARPTDPVSLPRDRRTRRLAVTAMSNRGIAHARERELSHYLGHSEGGDLFSDFLAASTSEVAAQLLLTEHLLDQGWQWVDILRSVWYREEALREVLNAD